MKTVLALEWSTRKLSVALGEISREMALERFRAPEAMALLNEVLAESGFDSGDIGEIRVGRGPGNFSGIRLAFAWAAGFAAPGGVHLVSISSGRALARRLLEVNPQGVLILGDARRGQWWGGIFRPKQSGEWEMHEPEIWGRRLRAEAAAGTPMRVISPDADRLAAAIECEALFPHARDLLAWTGAEEPAEPLYFHPPA